MKNTYNICDKLNYISHQPAFERISGRYSACRTKDDSLNKIMLFYEFNFDDNDAERVSAVPGGCTDIIFLCDNDNPQAKVCGSATKGKKVYYKPGSIYFGVRFLPGYDMELLKCPSKEFIDKEIPLNEIVEKDSYIIEKIATAGNFDNRVCIIEDYLKKFFINYNKDNKANLYSVIINKILVSNGNMKIDDLESETGYSSRYIRKVFSERFGISPKFFSRIIRFQNCLGNLLSNDSFKLNDIIQEHGYFDQSHFLKEYNEFCLLSPKQIRDTNAQGIADI